MVAVLVTFACQGEISTLDSESSRGSGAPGTAMPGEPSDPSFQPPTNIDSRENCAESGEELNVPPTVLRKLSRTEYRNTLRDLGLVDEASAELADNVGGDLELAGTFAIGGVVDDNLARDLYNGSLEIAQHAARNIEDLANCSPRDSNAETACARDFIENFGLRAFRRPLHASEVEQLLQVFEDLRASYDFRTGMEAVLASVLVSPDFLYLYEADPTGVAEGTIVAISDYEVASRLSYYLWDSMPDDALFRAAAAGELKTPDQLEAQARRMLEHPNAQVTIGRFFSQWTDADRLDGIKKDDPSFTQSVAENMKASLQAQTEQAFWEEGLGITKLLTSKTAFINDALAPFVGVEAPGSEELVEVDVPADQRSGLITHPAMMAILSKPGWSDPIHRGLFVRRNLLCSRLPPPPDDVSFEVQPPEPGLSTRERFAEHTASETCSGCHQMIDPIGFGFEHYDATGRYRTIDEGDTVVDASGEVINASDADGTFNGAVELGSQLADSTRVVDCMGIQFFRFALDREETMADACSNRSVLDAALESGNSLHEIAVAIVRTDAFRHRRVGAWTQENQQ